MARRDEGAIALIGDAVYLEGGQVPGECRQDCVVFVETRSVSRFQGFASRDTDRRDLLVTPAASTSPFMRSIGPSL